MFGENYMTLFNSDPHQEKLEKLLNGILPVGALREEPDIDLVELAAGEVLFREGDAGDSMYIVAAGVLGVRVVQQDGTEAVIDKLAPGAVVGELSLLSGQPRTATVYAENAAGLVRVTKKEFARLTPQERSRLTRLETTAVQRWRRLQLAQILQNLVGTLQTNELHELQEQMVWQHYSNGDLLFEQGEAADGMYIVVNGRLRAAIRNAAGEMEVVGEIVAGETVGEMALFTAGKRAATVYAVRETNVVHLSQAVFETLTQSRPELLRKIALILVRRQERSLRDMRRVPMPTLNLALLPAASHVDVSRFAAELAVALETFGRTLALDEARFDQLYGRVGAAQTAKDAPESAALVSWIDEIAAEHTHLLFAADYEPTEWTKRCISQADLVLVVADPDGDPGPGPVEAMLAGLTVSPETQLVLWHPPATAWPQGTLRWLQPRALSAHHHIRKDDAAHMQRLARRLTGNGIGLVLSGGGARGFAHMGVHRAMEELGIPFDYVGATSMGAVMGGAFVTIETNAEMMQLSQSFSQPKTLFDRTLPFTAIMVSRKVTQFTQDLYGDHQIEDLWIPFFCVASNLTTAQPEIIQQGPLWRAVRASLAIPGVFTPVFEDGNTLVDGGAVDNFPARLMYTFLKSEQIIGVNVAPFKEKKRQYDFDTNISGWQILWNRLNPFAKRRRVPSLIGIIMRTMEINSVRRTLEDERYVATMIYPDVQGIGMLDFAKFNMITQQGYEAAIEPLREWQRRRETLGGAGI
jgi:predicted acylesterase/phospholipase RssA/CRP-like cAMP-binding protein